jgi:Cu(I)/Ag(I) efflux system membrane fusion protein/cobalt-zinc-cadmium efflux system membrane fusion protein
MGIKNMKIFFTVCTFLAVSSLLNLHSFPEVRQSNLGFDALAEIIGPSSALAADQKYTCGMHPMIITDEPGLCPICNMDLTPLKSAGPDADKPQGERKIKYWVAPMDPTYIRDEPGKSPMGMDLVPVYEDEAPGGAIISIDPVTSQNMGVRTETVTKRDISRSIRTVGLVDYDEPNQHDITTKIAGWVERLYVDQTGQMVKKGEPLLEIYSPELVSAQEEFLLALDNSAGLANSTIPGVADGAKRLLDSARRRLSLWDISKTQITQLEKTRQVRKTMTLFTPDQGIVTMKMINEGAFVKPGTMLFKISDISKVWVMADIYEYELPWIKVGQMAKITLPYVGGQEVTGKVSYIYPFVEPKTRTIKARIELPNPGFELKPDMYVNVRLFTDPVQNALTIPSEAVLHSGERKRVFVALGNGKFEPREVKTGVEDEQGYVEIKAGLLPGERIVTSAQFMFDSESKLREAIQKMMEPKEPVPVTGGGEQNDKGGSEDLDSLFESDEDEDLEELFD